MYPLAHNLDLGRMLVFGHVPLLLAHAIAATDLGPSAHIQQRIVTVARSFRAAHDPHGRNVIFG